MQSWGGVFKKPLVQPDKCGQFTPGTEETATKSHLEAADQSDVA